MKTTKRSEQPAQFPMPLTGKNKSANAHMNCTNRAAARTGMTSPTGSKPKRRSSAARKDRSAPSEKPPPRLPKYAKKICLRPRTKAFSFRPGLAL
jgi:hypothetical protein